MDGDNWPEKVMSGMRIYQEQIEASKKRAEKRKVLAESSLTNMSVKSSGMTSMRFNPEKAKRVT
jgi:hypothetical protein